MGVFQKAGLTYNINPELLTQIIITLSVIGSKNMAESKFSHLDVQSEHKTFSIECYIQKSPYFFFLLLWFNGDLNF